MFVLALKGSQIEWVFSILLQEQKMAYDQIYGQFKLSFLTLQQECQLKYYVLLPVAWFDFEHTTNIAAKYYLYYEIIK